MPRARAPRQVPPQENRRTVVQSHVEGQSRRTTWPTRCTEVRQAAAHRTPAPALGGRPGRRQQTTLILATRCQTRSRPPDGAFLRSVDNCRHCPKAQATASTAASVDTSVGNMLRTCRLRTGSISSTWQHQGVFLKKDVLAAEIGAAYFGVFKKKKEEAHEGC